MPFAPIGPGLSMHYEDDCLAAPWHEPETILLIHGASMSHTHMYSWLPVLAPHLRVLRVDLPGFGLTKRPAGHAWSIGGAADELARFLDALELQSVHVVGAHMGSALALQLAAAHPSRVRTVTALVHGVVLIGEGGAGAAVDLSKIIGELHARGGYDADSPAARYGTRATPAQIDHWSKSRATVAQNIDAVTAVSKANLWEIYGKVKAPTVLIVPNRSAMVPLRSVLDTAARIAGSEVVIISSDAFDIALAEPDTVATECLRFVQRHARA